MTKHKVDGRGGRYTASHQMKGEHEMKSQIGEIVCSLLLMAAVFALGWLYLMATPDQMSGESDWTVYAEGGVQ